MDCSMPIMDGYQASKKIRQCIEHHHLCQPYIVACTGHDGEEYNRQAWQSKMDEVLIKGSSLIELMMEILANQVVVEKTE